MAETGDGSFIDSSTLIKHVLATRFAARKSGAYDIADQPKDALLQTGIYVHDGPDETSWSFQF